MLVQKLRLQRGWSQQQLAELSGLSVRTIQRIERGDTASIETLKSLAAVFEIDFSHLQTESDMNHSLQKGASPDELLAFEHVRQLRRFYCNLYAYAVVMIVLSLINGLVTPRHIWVIWPALGWGSALLARAVVLFQWIPFFGAEWEKRQVEKRLGRPL